MKPIKIIHLTILIMCMVVQSCDYVDFFEPFEVREIPVRFEWEDQDTVPQSMRVVFFPADETTRQRFKQGYTTFDMYSKGMNVSLPIGQYHAVSWNTDTENQQVEGYGSPEGLTVSMNDFPMYHMKKSNTLLDSLFFGLPVKDYPNYMVTGMVRDYCVEPENNKPVIIRNSPIVKKVRIRISSIKGMNGIQQLMLGIGPLKSKASVTQPSLTDNDCVILCEATPHITERMITSELYIFPFNNSTKQPFSHRIVLMFWLSGGNVYLPLEIGNLEDYYIPDEDIYLIELISLDIDLDDYFRSQDGFEVSADDWEDVNIDINI